MRLHESSKDFTDLIDVAAQHLRLRPVFIEKDYWVTYVLRKLSTSAYKEKIIFKGGTSLSKAYNVIQRFSEDIDLAVLSPGDFTESKMKSFLKSVSADITQGLDLIEGHPKEVKYGKNRTTAYKYPRTLNNAEFGIVKDYILVEINCFTNPLPYAKQQIESYAARFLRSIDELALISQFELEPFSVNVLSIERTYFEKVLSLSRLSYTGIEALIEKVRHFYDIYQIQNSTSLKGTILTPGNFDLLKRARIDDESNLTMSANWKKYGLADSPLFSDLDFQWKNLAPAYEKIMSDLVWSTPIPTSETILSTLVALKDFLKKFDKVHPPGN